MIAWIKANPKISGAITAAVAAGLGYLGYLGYDPSAIKAALVLLGVM